MVRGHRATIGPKPILRLQGRGRWVMSAMRRRMHLLPSGTQSEAGFTLIEVMAAMVIFAALSTVVFSILVQSLKTTHESSQRVIAANLAQSHIESLRLVGTTGIAPGVTASTPVGSNSDFSISTTANWVGLGQSTSACSAAQLGQAYMRIHVEVTGPRLSSPIATDAIIEPETAISSSGTGAAAISVIDQLGAPVSGITVTGLDSAHPTNSFSYTVGADGCLYVPQLIPTGSLVVSVTGPISPDYVAPTPTGATTTVPITAGSLARPTFSFAPAADIEFEGTLPNYPVAVGTPVTWSLNQTGASVQSGAIGTVIAGMWPTTAGFHAWLGDCTDADPQSYSTIPQSFALTPAGTTTALLDARPVKIRGLTASTQVTARHIGTGTGCTVANLDLGQSDSQGIVRTGLPSGLWSFTAAGQTQELSQPLSPPAPGDEEVPTVVNFTLADLDHPAASPTPTPTPTATP